MAKVKKKLCFGQEAIQSPSGDWEWTVDGRRYQWRANGLLSWFPVGSEQPALVAACKSVEVAMSYTAGWSDGYKSGTHDTTALLRPKENGTTALQ